MTNAQAGDGGAMPELNRRQALAATGAALTAALATALLSKPAQASPITPGLQAAIDDHLAKHARFRAAMTKVCDVEDALIAEGLGLTPKWTSRNWQMAGVTLRSVEEAKAHFAHRIETALGRTDFGDVGDGVQKLLLNGQRHYARHMEVLRDEAVASLERQEAQFERYGYDAAQEVQQEAQEDADDAFHHLCGFPCQTMEDMRAKAVVMLDTIADFTPLDKDSYLAVALRTFAGRA